ncbi:MAG: hypothetical protein ACRD8A_17810 [Candidatus Acidiferrales bacterium]
MRKRLGITTLLVILASLCAPSLVCRETRQLEWSADLSAYGYSAKHPYSDTVVAASNENVGVALNVSQDNNPTPDVPAAFPRSNWKLSFLVFDATNGKFRTTCGPWFGSDLFNLWPTSDGDFLLYQQARQIDQEETSGRLLLLSPSCQVMEKMELPALGKNGGAEFLMSPTRRTFLITEYSGRIAQSEVRDAKTLVERFKIAPASDEPQIVAASDDGLLGIKSEQSASSTTTATRLFYLDFHTQKWREVPGPMASYASNSVRFVSDDAFVDAATTGRTDAWAASGVRIIVRRMDGTAVFSTVMSRKAASISLGSPLAVSPTGKYFGVVLSSYSVASFWRFLDMSPGHDQGYIWSIRSAKPIARISAQRAFLCQQLSFAPDDSWFAFCDGKMLMVSRLPG